MQRISKLTAVLAAVLFLTRPSIGADRDPIPPDRALEAFCHALANNQPQVEWECLPKSYQRDISEIIHEPAAKMDPEVWNKAVEVAGKFRAVLEKKREFVIVEVVNHFETTGDQGKREELKETVLKVYPNLVRLVSIILDSELSSLDELRRLDVHAFLANTGPEIMEQVLVLWEATEEDQFNDIIMAFKTTTAELVDLQDSTAVVKVKWRTPDSTEAEEGELEMVLVEGKWIPRGFAEWYAARVPEIVATIKLLPRQIPHEEGEDWLNKSQVLSLLRLLEIALDGMLAADTQAEFHQARIVSWLERTAPTRHEDHEFIRPAHQGAVRRNAFPRLRCGFVWCSKWRRHPTNE